MLTVPNSSKLNKTFVGNNLLIRAVSIVFLRTFGGNLNDFNDKTNPQFNLYFMLHENKLYEK